MSIDAVNAALQALGQSLNLQATVQDNVVRARLLPDLQQVNLADWALGGLATPVMAPLRIAGAAKNVGFPTGAITDGDPTHPATKLTVTPLPDAENLTNAGVQPDSPLQAVLGLLGGIEGLVPAGVVSPSHIAVSATICWDIRPDDKCARSLPLEPTESLPTVADPTRQAEKGMPAFVCSAVSSASAVELPVVPPIVAMTLPPQPNVCTYLLSARVVLRALGAEHVVDLGPIEVPVPAVEVPTVLVVFSEFHYNTAKEGAKMVILPGNVPNQQLETLTNVLNGVSSSLASLSGFVRIAGMLAGLGSVTQALAPLPADSKHKRILTSFDEEDDLGDVAPDWRHRTWFDNHGAEDDIASLLMISVDRWVQLFEDQGFEGTQVDVKPSPALYWIGIPDFRDMRGFIPDTASVDAGKRNFNDKAHSIRFRAS